MCRHCIPAMPTDAGTLCNVCNVAQCDDKTLMSKAGSLHGCTLVSLASDQKVSVYHHKSSGRQGVVAVPIADLSVSHSSRCLMLLVQVLQWTNLLSDQDSIFNWSSKYMITYETGCEYADNMAQSRLPFSEPHQQKRNRFKHSDRIELSMTCGTHRQASTVQA